MGHIVVEANNLTRHYLTGFRGRNGRIEAVRGIDLAVQRGEIFGLVGPDGAGKTTTIQMLCGILTLSAGSATVAGVDVVQDAEALGGKIGYMSEGFTLYGNLSVEENIDFFADLYKVPPDVAAERKEELLRFARLEGARHRRAEHLSGGMKKKLALACTLIYRPQVLFLDEPTTGVDPVSRQDFWKILYEFLAEGITIFVTTPYMDEAERCHRVALMRQGQIIASDAPSTLKKTFAGVAVEMIARPQTQAVARLREMPAVTQVQVFGERLHLLLRNGHQQAEDLPDQLASAA
ncbi:MAG: ABC transporter ATP-binding protein [Anaerolineae bacterium]